MLAATRKELGMIPNLSRIMAGAPALLTAYESLHPAHTADVRIQT